MYAGHVAAAFIGKGARPRIPLWVLVLVSQAPDWLVIVGRLTGHSIDRVEHFSETAYSYVLVAFPIAFVYLIFSKDRRSAATVWLVGASHQVCDFFTGSKAFMPGGQLVGLGWYHRPVRDFLMESGLLLVAAWIYKRRVAPEPRKAALLVITFSTLVLAQTVLDVYLASSVRNGWFAEQVNSGQLFH